jgi:hypothetical protein
LSKTRDFCNTQKPSGLQRVFKFGGIMREYRITTQNLDYPQENDCVLDENDSIHAIKKAIMLGGLGMPNNPRLNPELLKKFWPKDKED